MGNRVLKCRLQSRTGYAPCHNTRTELDDFLWALLGLLMWDCQSSSRPAFKMFEKACGFHPFIYFQNVGSVMYGLYACLEHSESPEAFFCDIFNVVRV